MPNELRIENAARGRSIEKKGLSAHTDLPKMGMDDSGREWPRSGSTATGWVHGAVCRSARTRGWNRKPAGWTNGIWDVRGKAAERRALRRQAARAKSAHTGARRLKKEKRRFRRLSLLAQKSR